MKNHQDTAPTPRELLNDLQTLASDAKTMITDSVTEHSSEAISNLRERFDAAQERFSAVYDTAKKKVVAGAKQTDATIRSHPYQSLAIAGAVGLLVGILVGRRNR